MLIVGGPITLVGDSVLRGLFYLMACALLPHVPAPPHMEGAHFVGPAHIRTTFATTLDFVWADSLGWTRDVERTVRSSFLVVVHFGSHAKNASHARSVWRDLARAMGLGSSRAPRRILVLSYLPAHFPGGAGDGEWRGRTESGQVDWQHMQLYADKDARCAPHASSSSNFRRQVSLEFAASHGLAVLDAWDAAVPHYEDHPGAGSSSAALMLGRSIDCKHWCAPGRTLLHILRELLMLMANQTMRELGGSVPLAQRHSGSARLGG